MPECDYATGEYINKKPVCSLRRNDICNCLDENNSPLQDNCDHAINDKRGAISPRTMQLCRGGREAIYRVC
jgi:hypothetical protein